MDASAPHSRHLFRRVTSVTLGSLFLLLGCGGEEGPTTPTYSTLVISTSSLPNATPTVAYNETLVATGGEDHPNADVRFKLGDIVTTVITTANGESVILSHDTNLPRPYSLNFRVQGTRGLWMVDNRSIYLEGVSPEPHRWEPFDTYQTQYEHPLWQQTKDTLKDVGGHGNMDYLVDYRFMHCLHTGTPPDMDVYDAAVWSAVTALSENSIASGSQTVDFPDFTRGKWQQKEPLGIETI